MSYSGELFVALKGDQDFRYVDLRYAHFMECVLWRNSAVFDHADLRFARFTRCRVGDIDFNGSDLSGTQFVDCRAPHRRIRALHDRGARFYLSRESLFNRAKGWLM